MKNVFGTLVLMGHEHMASSAWIEHADPQCNIPLSMPVEAKTSEWLCNDVMCDALIGTQKWASQR